jgi:hypothetical protein
MAGSRLAYSLAFLLLLAVEVAIALFVRDRFVRPLVGDMLVVILLYCLLQAIFLVRPAAGALGVFLFACLIEGLQAMSYAAWLGVDHIGWARVVLGTTFSWMDLVAYAVGCALLRLDPRWV